MKTTKPTAAQMKLMTAAAKNSGKCPTWTTAGSTEEVCIKRGWMARIVPGSTTTMLTPAGYSLVTAARRLAADASRDG